MISDCHNFWLTSDPQNENKRADKTEPYWPKLFPKTDGTIYFPLNLRTYINIIVPTFNSPKEEEILKSTQGRRESGPLQRRRQLLRHVRAGQVGETVEPGQEGAPQVVHRTRLRGEYFYLLSS